MRKALLAALLVAPLAFAAGRSAGQQQGAQALNPETQRNLDSAMHGEGFAAAKYQLFAEHARQSGHPEIAKLFEDAAKVERTEHFGEEAKLSGLVGSDADNLRNAIKGEDYEQSTMYPGFARDAEARGDKAAADRFREIAGDERKHRDAFQAELNKLENPSAQTPSPTPQARRPAGAR